MAAKTVAFPGHRMASAPLDDVPHRRRGASYPEAGRSDPKHDVLLIQDTRVIPFLAGVATRRKSENL